ncbi:MAG: hypothetical protein LBU32_28820 [Clostridiales bacterium]|nr:hypothetical protein [Clostridiales bacterium]
MNSRAVAQILSDEKTDGSAAMPLPAGKIGVGEEGSAFKLEVPDAQTKIPKCIKDVEEDCLLVIALERLVLLFCSGQLAEIDEDALEHA